MFVDANVLVTASNLNDPMQPNAKRALDAFVTSTKGYMSNQICREYILSVTRPIEVKGLGWTPMQAWSAVDAFQSVLQILTESAESLLNLQRLCLQHHVRGKQIHDANIVATMLAHGERKLLTFNAKDFARYTTEINIITP
jgi:predicted nucleic acid-binding protein